MQAPTKNPNHSLGGGPAFPSEPIYNALGDVAVFGHHGMSFLDYAATHVLAALVSSADRDSLITQAEQNVAMAYAHAGLMAQKKAEIESKQMARSRESITNGER